MNPHDLNIVYSTPDSISFASGGEREVAAAVEALRKAMISSDKNALENIAAQELSYGHSNGRIEDKNAFVDTLVSKRSDFKAIDLFNQTIKIAGNTAIVRHQLAAKTNDGGKPGEVNLNILQVWQKQNDQWKLIARQAFK